MLPWSVKEPLPPKYILKSVRSHYLNFIDQFFDESRKRGILRNRRVMRRARESDFFTPVPQPLAFAFAQSSAAFRMIIFEKIQGLLITQQNMFHSKKTHLTNGHFYKILSHTMEHHQQGNGRVKLIIQTYTTSNAKRTESISS